MLMVSTDVEKEGLSPELTVQYLNMLMGPAEAVLNARKGCTTQRKMEAGIQQMCQITGCEDPYMSDSLDSTITAACACVNAADSLMVVPATKWPVVQPTLLSGDELTVSTSVPLDLSRRRR